MQAIGASALGTVRQPIAPQFKHCAGQALDVTLRREA
jgi:hypothetical protein